MPSWHRWRVAPPWWKPPKNPKDWRACMATGGRVLHHLALHAGHHRNLILLTGYQTPGTRGARLAAGEKTLRMLGQEVSIRAQVEQLQSASAHADAEQLLAWLQQG